MPEQIKPHPVNDNGLLNYNKLKKGMFLLKSRDVLRKITRKTCAS